MNTQNRKELLDKYIKEFKQYTENSGDLHDTDFESSKKVYRKLETKDDVMKILSQEYLKEYKELDIDRFIENNHNKPFNIFILNLQ